MGFSGKRRSPGFFYDLSVEYALDYAGDWQRKMTGYSRFDTDSEYAALVREALLQRNMEKGNTLSTSA
ncbi:MAG: hypothetical protein LBD48_10440 [Treponema sp.]|jgi:hypothetical protein|nr:hypothetical protein [Treponema sp.]